MRSERELGWYFDRRGRPIDLLTWGRLNEDPAYKRIAETTLPNGIWISTVWLGADHGAGRPPIIFETMAFGEGTDNDCKRYATEAEARAGHEAMVAKWAPASPKEPSDGE
jgi:hypothetical protein